MPVVRIPTPLRPHAGGHDRVEAAGSTVGESPRNLGTQLSRPSASGSSTAASFAGSSMSMSTTKTSATSTTWRRRSPPTTRSASSRPSPGADRNTSDSDPAPHCRMRTDHGMI